MSAAFPIPLTAAQFGTYFVGQYYQVLQQQPEIVHQFYSDSSTMLRVDGLIRESATAMLQIHTLVMTSNFVGVEIKTINSLESWNGGLLVIISGSVRRKNFSGTRKFVQTFFLAPQEKGLFILNDVFHFVEEDQTHHHPAVLLAHNNLNVNLSATTTNEEPVPSYSGEDETRDFTPPKAKENGPTVDNDMLQRSDQVSETENFHEGSVVAESNGPAQDAVVDHTSTSVDEAIGELPKHTYASILRVAKGQSVPSVTCLSKNLPPASEWDQPPLPEPSNQQRLASPNTYERSGVEPVEEVSGVEYEGYDVKSVYVRNLPSTVLESEIKEEFSKFGRIRVDGVVIRGRKDLGVCYAFVEFEDVAGVQNAVKAASAQVAGRHAYIEERRPNNNDIPSRGKGKGRGRGGRQQSEAPRGRFRPHTFGGGDSEYHNKPRGNNGFHRSNPRQASSGGNQQATPSQTPIV